MQKFSSPLPQLLYLGEHIHQQETFRPNCSNIILSMGTVPDTLTYTRHRCPRLQTCKIHPRYELTPFHIITTVLNSNNNVQVACRSSVSRSFLLCLQVRWLFVILAHRGRNAVSASHLLKTCAFQLNFSELFHGHGREGNCRFEHVGTHIFFANLQVTPDAGYVCHLHGHGGLLITG